MKKIVIIVSLVLTTALLMDVGMAAQIGKTYDEIVALAKKEGTVRLVASQPDRATKKRFFEPFIKKYGLKIDWDDVSGAETRETLLLELRAGKVDFDCLHVSGELINDYIKAGVMEGPFEWDKIFPIRPVFVDPKKFFVVVGATAYGINYNPDAVPKERLPRKWEDLLDPWFKGKIVTSTRPTELICLWEKWGEEKTLKFARDLMANKPIFQLKSSLIRAGVSSGEYPIWMGGRIGPALNMIENDPGSKIRPWIPSPIPVKKNMHLGVAKGAKNPNAAMLFAAWYASDEGQKHFDKVLHRGSPLVEGTEKQTLIKEAGAEMIYIGWDLTTQEQERRGNKILEAYGLKERYKIED